MKKLMAAVAFALALILAFAGCGGQQPAPAEPEGQTVPEDGQTVPTETDGGKPYMGTRYEVWVDIGDFWDGETVYMDGDGNVLPDESCGYIYDVGTNEKSFWFESKRLDTGEDDEYGNPVTDYWSRLWSQDGEPVTDWMPYRFTFSLGKFVAAVEYTDWFDDLKEDAEAFVLNTETGERLLEGVSSFTYVCENRFACTNNQYYLMGVIDSDANIVAGFEDTPIAGYYSPCRGYILTDEMYNSDEVEYKYDKECLLDADLNLIYEGNGGLNILYVGLIGPYFIEKTGSVTSIRSLDTFEVVYTAPSGMDLDYYDGERIILSTFVNGNREKTLYDKNGRAIAGPYETLEGMGRMGMNTDYETPDELFFYENGDEFGLIDRNGKVVREGLIENLDFISKTGNYYEYCSEGFYGILDSDFNPVTDFGMDYESSSIVYDYETDEDYGIFMMRKTENGRQVDYLIDSEGEILTGKPFSYVGTAADGKIAVKQGKYIGLIDREGNWIKKTSVYDLGFYD